MKTTKEHFKLFQAECEKWLSFFGLYEWSVRYAHRNNNGCYAMCECDHEGKVCVFSLSTSFLVPEYGIIKQIKKSAFHEVCELLLSKMRLLADSRSIQPHEVTEEIHRLIRIFENTILENLK